MTQDEHAFHLRVRRNQIAQIIERASQYKVCDQCRSLVPKSSVHCPFCATYRFNEDIEYVKATAEEAAAVAVPVGAPFVPRIRKETLLSAFKAPKSR